MDIHQPFCCFSIPHFVICFMILHDLRLYDTIWSKALILYQPRLWYYIIQGFMILYDPRLYDTTWSKLQVVSELYLNVVDYLTSSCSLHLIVLDLPKWNTFYNNKTQLQHQIQDMHDVFWMMFFPVIKVHILYNLTVSWHLCHYVITHSATISG